MSAQRIQLMIAFLAVIFFGCPAVQALDPFILPDVHPDAIHGSWTLKEAGKQHVITFKKDKTFSGVYYEGGKVVDEYEGTWIIKTAYNAESTLHYTYTKSRRIAAGTEDTDLLGTLNNKFLVVYTGNGRNAARRAWHRVEEKK